MDGNRVLRQALHHKAEHIAKRGARKGQDNLTNGGNLQNECQDELCEEKVLRKCQYK